MTEKTLEQFQKARSNLEAQILFSVLLAMQLFSTDVAHWRRHDIGTVDAALAAGLLAIIGVDAWGYRRLGPMPIQPRRPLDPEVLAVAKRLHLRAWDDLAGVVILVGVLILGAATATLDAIRGGTVDWLLVDGEAALMAFACLIFARLRQLGRQA